MKKNPLTTEEKARRNREKSRRWRAKNPEKVRAYQRTYAKKKQKEARTRTRLWKASNPEKTQMQRRRYYVTNPEKVLLSRARYRARKQGIPFEITLEDIPVPKRCPALGIKLAWGKKHVRPNSPSIDKIKPELGYVPGNVVVISHRANRIKNDATVTELRKIARWMNKQNSCI